MHIYLQREHLANGYFLNILARVSKGLNPSPTAGVENLNTQIFKELNINYKSFLQIKDNAVKHHLIDINSPDYAFLIGIENVVEDGVAFYLNRHGHVLEASSDKHALQIAIEALKDEFEGENGESMEVSENGDTNSSVIQAILDDLKNRQADEVSRTVNLILKLNADKQRELLDEQQANADEINDTMSETGLDGSEENPDEALDGENPLEDGNQDLNDGDTSFDDDPFADTDNADGNDKKSKSAEEDAPTLEDKKAAKNNEGNPFEGFESMMLNGRSALDKPGMEAGLTFNVGSTAGFIKDTLNEVELLTVLHDTMKDVSEIADFGVVDLIKSFSKHLTTNITKEHLWNALKKNYIGMTLGVLKNMGMKFLANKLANFRFEQDLSGTSQDGLAKIQGANKGKLHMTSEQYQKAYKTYSSEMQKIIKEATSRVKKNKILSDVEKFLKEKNAEYQLCSSIDTNQEVSVIDISGILDMSLLSGVQKEKDLAQYVPQVESAYQEILSYIDSEMTNLKQKRQDFTPFISMLQKKNACLAVFGFESNVIVSQAFTESEFRDVLEGMAETLGEDDATIAFRFMHDMNTGIGNEDEIGRIDSLYSEGVEFTLATPLDLLSFTFSLAMRKLKKYKLGENIYRKTLTLPEDDYNKELKEVESIAKANARYLEGALRAKSKFLTWCLDVGAIKVIDNPQFIDGIAMVVVIDTINPIEVDKDNKKLKYKSQTVDLSHVGVSKYKLMPFKNLGAILVKACEDVNKTISDVLTQRLDGYSLYGGINPIEGRNSDSGWAIIAHNNKQPKAVGVESEELNMSYNEPATESTDAIFYDPEKGFVPGTEGIISAFKNKWNSMSVLKSSIEMTTNEYQSLASEFKNYGKECFENLKVDIKNDPNIGLLGLTQYLKSNFEVKQDAKKRPMVLIYKTDKGLIPSSHWKNYEGGNNLKTQNTKIDQLISIIKKSIESFVAETKFKGMNIFPVIARDLTQAYAVIANPIEIKAEGQTESYDIFKIYQPITAGFDQPLYGTESHLEMKESYRVYNQILTVLKHANTFKDQLKEKAQLDYVFGDRSYQACVESFTCDPNTLIDKLEFKDGYINIPLFTLDPSNTSVMYKNEFLYELNNVAKQTLSNIGIESEVHLVDIYNPNGSKPLVYGYLEFGYYNTACESLNGEKLLSQLADNYLMADYQRDIVLENQINDNGRYGLLGLESDNMTYLAENPFNTMTLGYHYLTKYGMSKLKAEFYMNNLYQTPTIGTEELMNTLHIDEHDAEVINKRNKYLTYEYLKGGAESALIKYSSESIYNTIKGYMQKSLDCNGVDGIAYEPKYGLIIGLESSDNIKVLAKNTIKLQKENPLPEYIIPNVLKAKDGQLLNILQIPLSLGTESLRDIPQILKSMKSSLQELEFYHSLKDVGDIAMKNIFGFTTHPLASTGNQLQKHITNLMIGARAETLKHAYTQYGVESYEYKNIQKEFEASVNNVFKAYITSICLAGRLGIPADLTILYQNLTNN